MPPEKKIWDLKKEWERMGCKGESDPNWKLVFSFSEKTKARLTRKLSVQAFPGLQSHLAVSGVNKVMQKSLFTEQPAQSGQQPVQPPRPNFPLPNARPAIGPAIGPAISAPAIIRPNKPNNNNTNNTTTNSSSTINLNAATPAVPIPSNSPTLPPNGTFNSPHTNNDNAPMPPLASPRSNRDTNNNNNSEGGSELGKTKSGTTWAPAQHTSSPPNGGMNGSKLHPPRSMRAKATPLSKESAEENSVSAIFQRFLKGEWVDETARNSVTEIPGGYKMEESGDLEDGETEWGDEGEDAYDHELAGLLLGTSLGQSGQPPPVAALSAEEEAERKKRQIVGVRDDPLGLEAALAAVLKATAQRHNRGNQHN